MGDCLLWAVFLFITEVAQNILLLFPKNVPIFYIDLDKTNALGYILGDFFKNSPGRPGKSGKEIVFENRVARLHTKNYNLGTLWRDLEW
jgi:hypothetical protein